jgi:DNA processing protein
VLVESDPRYPAGLRALHDPPPVIFARGRLELLDRPALAIVGSRRPTAYGREAARALAAGVARAGVVVVSGMARGIDGVAHEAAFEGGTIGVLGCGVDVLYPFEHARLFERLAVGGLLLSEFAPGEPALRYHFPRRNRLIAALARGVLVVEASERSGALITVDHALDLNLEVMAVPGPIGRETSAGTNALIRDGATMVLGVSDILGALGMESAPAGSTGAMAEVVAGASPSAPGDGPAAAPGSTAPPELGAEALGLWRALGSEPTHAEALAAASGLDPAAALVQLLELELAGHIRQLAGMRFVRVAPEWSIG